MTTRRQNASASPLARRRAGRTLRALLLWGGLFLRSLSNAQNVDIGMIRPECSSRDSSSRRSDQVGRDSAVSEGLHERIEGIPGVETQGLTRSSRCRFLDARKCGCTPRAIRASRALGAGQSGRPRMVSDRADSHPRRTRFHARRLGRRPGHAAEAAARQFWSGDALGKRIHDAEVIGVVADSKYWSLGEDIRPTVYTAYYQRPEREITIFLRTSNLAAAAKALRADIGRVDPTLYADIGPMTDALSPSLVPAQAGAAVTSGFGALGAILAMMGIYGLVAFTVAQRTREIGIRKAVGASTSAIVALIVAGTARPVAIGLIGGLALGILGARARRLCGRRFGCRPADSGWNDSARSGNDSRRKRVPGAEGREDRPVGGVEGGIRLWA